MSVAWTSYMPEILPDVPGCSEIMAVNAVRNAAIRLCERAHVWKYDFPANVSLVADDPDYVLAPPAGSVVHTIKYLGFFPAGSSKSQEVVGMSENELDRLRPGWREEESEGTVNTATYFTLEGNTIRIIPIPVVNQADALTVSAILKPTRTSTDGPDILFNDWLEAIAHGAKWKLMVMKNKEWSDPKTAFYHENQFNRGINNATAKVLKGGTNRSLSVWQREFGR